VSIGKGTGDTGIKQIMYTDTPPFISCVRSLACSQLKHYINHIEEIKVKNEWQSLMAERISDWLIPFIQIISYPRLEMVFAFRWRDVVGCLRGCILLW
jgi:hypothetical protein